MANYLTEELKNQIQYLHGVVDGSPKLASIRLALNNEGFVIDPRTIGKLWASNGLPSNPYTKGRTVLDQDLFLELYAFYNGDLTGIANNFNYSLSQLQRQAEEFGLVKRKNIKPYNKGDIGLPQGAASEGGLSRGHYRAGNF